FGGSASRCSLGSRRASLSSQLPSRTGSRSRWCSTLRQRLPHLRLGRFSSTRSLCLIAWWACWSRWIGGRGTRMGRR
ncbi:unnamed protein product, partial [Prorocentrum cordatum]